ncbi:MAG: hypothetical protein AAFW75_04605, partial [Cyanobacteria bacterium J06636_16]
MKTSIKPLGCSMLVSVMSTVVADPAWAQDLTAVSVAASQDSAVQGLDVVGATTIDQQIAPYQNLAEIHQGVPHEDAAAILTDPQQDSWLAQDNLAQDNNGQAVITDVQISSTPEGLTVTLVS